jgi:hypothetical protein
LPDRKVLPRGGPAHRVSRLGGFWPDDSAENNLMAQLRKKTAV